MKALKAEYMLSVPVVITYLLPFKFSFVSYAFCQNLTNTQCCVIIYQQECISDVPAVLK
jgi:hypothetical protein